MMIRMDRALRPWLPKIFRGDRQDGLTGAYDFSVPIAGGQLPDQIQQAAEDAGVVSVSSG
jgi:hypothetical protein